MIGIDVVGIEGVEATFATLAEHIGDLFLVEAEVHAILTAGLATEYENGGQGAGGWTPDLPATVTEKERHGYGDRVLVATGALESSYTDPSDANHVWTIGDGELDLSSGLDYAQYQQDRGRDPAPLAPDVEAEVVAAVRSLLVERVMA